MPVASIPFVDPGHSAPRLIKRLLSDALGRRARFKRARSERESRMFRRMIAPVLAAILVALTIALAPVRPTAANAATSCIGRLTWVPNNQIKYPGIVMTGTLVFSVDDHGVVSGQYDMDLFNGPAPIQ